MSKLYEQWKKAKTDFDKLKVPESELGEDFAAFYAKGADFGPALKKFDAADTFAGRQAVMPTVLTTKAKYEKAVRIALGEAHHAHHPKAEKALKGLQEDLVALGVAVDKAAQAPKPGGREARYEVIRQFNLAQGLKLKYLDMEATKVDVSVQIDSVLDDLMASGEADLKIAQFGDAAQAALDKCQGAFQKTILDLEAKLVTQFTDDGKRAAKVKEANEVLKHYAQIVRTDVEKAVADEWAKYVGRAKHLSDFQVASTVKVVLGTIGIGVAVASAVLSFGALWMNVVVAVKATSDLAQNLKTAFEGMDTTYERLIKDLEVVDALELERVAARRSKGGSLTGAKAKEVGKELAVALLPITKNLLSAASDVESRAKQFIGQASKVDAQADKLVGELNKLLDEAGKASAALQKIPSEDKDRPALAKRVNDLQAATERLLKEIPEVHAQAQHADAVGQAALAAVTRLRGKDEWSGAAGTARGLGYGTKGAALIGLGKFIVQCAAL
jgi:hypothetical protein